MDSDCETAFPETTLDDPVEFAGPLKALLVTRRATDTRSYRCLSDIH